ncbi:MBL fold metallo-hydrolase [Actinoplanes sp. NPDC020271]|uniref:MBL fold metallo-hydrolase n=1 Tax=Actinoplanes sp. NPDC020271 TaxID=3363896 RepID=UPI0037AA4833
MNVSDEPVFLRSNAIIEPLVDRFYAWMHIVSPAQASMNLAKVQIPLLESYLQNPQVHMAASVNPALRGGYFVNVDESRSNEVAELLDTIKRDRADMLAFNDAIAEADDLLRQNATGFDLTPLYPRLPAPLNGLVELAYDTGNQASLHLLEPVLYTSPVYDTGRQSIQLSLETGVERPFILSTPRLPQPGVLDLEIPFQHAGIDELFAARIAPTTVGHLREMLELDDAQTVQLRRLLTDEPSLSPDRAIASGGRVRYFGHACLVIQSADTTIITDPFISADNRHGDRYTLDDLPDRIDYVLITHGHQDHIVLETLFQLRKRIGAVVVPRSSRGNLCDPSIALYLRALGFTVVDVDDFDEIAIPGGRIVATPFLGEHSDLDIRSKSTYFVQIADANIYVGADSSGIDPVLYRHVRRHLGNVDMAFLGMECDGAPLTWLYQGLLTRPVTKKMSDSRKLSGSNAQQAAAIMTELGADEGYIYAMGEESWQGHVMATTYNEDTYQMKQIAEFLTWCSSNGITAEHLFNKREWRW